MVDNSLLLLAVKRSIALGRGALKGGNSFQTLYGISSLEQAEVENTFMKDYIDVMVSECVEKIPARLASYKDEIVSSLREAAEFESYEWGEDSNLFCNSFYENNIGKLSLFVYMFMPQNNAMTKCESMNVDLTFRLADIAVTLTFCKKRLFGRKKRWTEIRYVKPAVSFNDFINALAIIIAPLLDSSTGVATPNGLQEELKSQAAGVPDQTPSDDARRTVYDPMRKMNVVVTSEEVLKLIPGRWETVTSEMVQAQVAQNTWEFDE